MAANYALIIVGLLQVILFATTNAAVAKLNVIRLADDHSASAALNLGLEIGIGTPPQTFRVRLSTSEADLFIPDISCTSGQCTERNRFVPANSSTFIKTGYPWTYNSHEWLPTYQSTPAAQGYYGNDTVTIGGMPIEGQLFGVAQSMSGFSDKIYDGKIGLAFPYLASYYTIQPFLNAAYRNIFNRPLTTLYLKKEGEAEGSHGQLTVGDFDTEHCSQERNFYPIPHMARWNLPIKSIGVEGKTTISLNTNMVFDITITTILGPRNILKQLAIDLGASAADFSISCNATASPIVLVINGDAYKIEFKNLIVKSQTGKCSVALASSEDYWTSWVIGLPFMYQYCQIYGYGQERLGFAAAIA